MRERSDNTGQTGIAEPVRLARIEQTCDACPSQWDAWTWDGTYHYIRYRWGFLSVNKGSVDGEMVFGQKIGGVLDGFMTTEEMLADTGMASALIDGG